MVAALLFLPCRPSRKSANPFSSVMVCMSAPVFVMSSLLSHTARKSTRAGHLSKMIPITWCFIHYMVPVRDAVKAEIVKCGSGKTDYRNLRRVGSMVYKDLFDGRGKKRKYQLQGGRVPLRECVVTDRRVAHAKTMSFRPSRQVLEEAGCPALNGCPTQSDRANEALSRCTMVF